MSGAFSAVPGLAVLLVIPVALVLAPKLRLGAPLLPGDLATAVAGLLLLEIGSLLCLWAGFVLAGGPDGRFLAEASLQAGSLFLLAALFLVFLALRLLGLPGFWWGISYLLPVALTFVARLIDVWSLVVFGFAAGPLLCFCAIAARWLRREWAGN